MLPPDTIPDLAVELAGLRAALARLVALAQQPSEPQSSVEIARNSKGATQIAVKVYSADPTAAATTAQDLYDSLVSRYRVSQEQES